MNTLETFDSPGPVDPRIQVTGYVQAEPVYDAGGYLVSSLIVHTTNTLWPLVLDCWSVAAALHCGGARLTGDTDLDDLARLIVRGVQLAGWLRVGAMGVAAQDIGTRIEQDTADGEDHLLVVEAWGSDLRRQACYAVAQELCAGEHTRTLREIPGRGHCPTLGEVAW